MDQPELFIPNYMSFSNENTFLGSYQGLRFKLTPDVKAETVRAEYWSGPLCYEKSTMDGEEAFPLSEEGLAEMKQFLLSLSQSPAQN